MIERGNGSKRWDLPETRAGRIPIFKVLYALKRNTDRCLGVFWVSVEQNNTCLTLKSIRYIL